MIKVFKWSEGFNKGDFIIFGNVLRENRNEKTCLNGFRLEKFIFRH